MGCGASTKSSQNHQNGSKVLRVPRRDRRSSLEPRDDFKQEEDIPKPVIPRCSIISRPANLLSRGLVLPYTTKLRMYTN